MPARQQTLRNTIQWSYDLLDAQEQRLFCLLSVFVGGCTLAAVEEVSAALGDTALPVLDGVASLLDKNLLQQTAQQGEEVRLLSSDGRSSPVQAGQSGHSSCMAPLHPSG